MQSGMQVSPQFSNTFWWNLYLSLKFMEMMLAHPLDRSATHEKQEEII